MKILCEACAMKRLMDFRTYTKKEVESCDDCKNYTECYFWTSDRPVKEFYRKIGGRF